MNELGSLGPMATSVLRIRLQSRCGHTWYVTSLVLHHWYVTSIFV